MSNPTDIGSGSSTYTLTSSEEGKKIKVEVSFTDDDNNSEGPLVSGAYPSSGTVVQLSVSFLQGAYTVSEGDMVIVTVTLSAEPERTVVIPITHTSPGRGGIPRRLLRGAREFDVQLGGH